MMRVGHRTLGGGSFVEFLQFAGAALPAAAIVVHRVGCVAVVSWHPQVEVNHISGAACTTNVLVSLRPLTLGEPITCPRCGETGSVENDRWLPTAAPRGGDA